MNTFDNIVYTVSDVEAAKAIHAALLDTEPHTDQPYYVGFNVGGVEIALAPGAGERPAGSVAHIRVPDIKAALERVQAAGARIVEEPHEVGGGTVLATVSDPDGTVLGLIQRG